MTLTPDVEAQIVKYAREIAQAETARALRVGKFVDSEGVLDATGVHEFEARRREELASSQRCACSLGYPPPDLYLELRALAKLPNINDLKGAEAPIITDTRHGVHPVPHVDPALMRAAMESLTRAILERYGYT